MNHRRRVQPVPVLGLAAVWVMLWGDLSVGNAVAGLLLGVVVSLVFPLPRIFVDVRLRPWRLALLLLTFLLDLARASAQVAWQSVRPGPPPRSAVFSVPLLSEDELFQTVIAEMLCLVPGSLVIDIDTERRLLKVHALGVSTPQEVERVRADVAALERRVLLALAADPERGSRPAEAR